MSEIAIIGAGAWGTGLAIVLGRKGTHRVRLWAFEDDVCRSINEKRVNDKFLPGRHVPDTVSANHDFKAILAGAQIIVSVMPSQHCRRLFKQIRSHLEPKAIIVSATKGIEEGSLLRMSEVIRQVLSTAGAPPLSRSSRQGGDFDFRSFRVLGEN